MLRKIFGTKRLEKKVCSEYLRDCTDTDLKETELEGLGWIYLAQDIGT